MMQEKALMRCQFIVSGSVSDEAMAATDASGPAPRRSQHADVLDVPEELQSLPEHTSRDRLADVAVHRRELAATVDGDGGEVVERRTRGFFGQSLAQCPFSLQ